MMNEVRPFHKPLPSAAAAAHPPIRHPRIKSLQGSVSHVESPALCRIPQSNDGKDPGLGL